MNNLELLLIALIFIMSIYTLNKIIKIGSKLDKLLQNPQASKSLQTHENTAPIPSKPITAYSKKSPINKLFTWYGTPLILLCFSWIIINALINNYVGPIEKIAFGITTSALIILIGRLHMEKFMTQGIILVWIGALIMTQTIYIAQATHHIFSPIIALLLLMLVMIVITIIALRFNSISLSIAALIIGGSAPILIGHTEKSIFGLYSYLTVATIGTIWIAHYTRLRIFTFLALIITAIYSLEYFITSATWLKNTLAPSEFAQLRFFAALLTSIFFFVNASTILNKRNLLQLLLKPSTQSEPKSTPTPKSTDEQNDSTKEEPSK